MYHVNCSNPQIIVNPSLRHLIRFCDTFCYLNSDWDWKCIQLSTDKRNRIIFGENPLNVFGMVSPNNMEFFSYEDKFDYCSKHVFMTENGEVVDLYMEVACGQCALCRGNYQYTLRQRLLFALQEVKQLPYFVTLTYKKGYEPKRGPDVRVIQLMKKRLKMVLEREYNYDSSLVKFIVVSEDGHNHDNLHYHMIVLGLPLLHQNLDTNNLIVNHLFEYLWRLPEFEYDKDGNQSLNPLSFHKYRVKYPQVFKRRADYDPFSRGFISCTYLKDVKQSLDYVTKYICKSIEDKEKCFIRFKDPVTHKSVKHYVKFDKRGWRPHFLICSQNLGVDFAKNLTVRPDGKVAFHNWFDNQLYIVNLSSYFIKKLYPSFSQLVPPNIRRAFDDCMADIAILVRSRFCSRDVRKMLCNTSIYLRNNFPDFCADDIEDPQFRHDFPTDAWFDSHMESVARNTSILYSWLVETDLEELARKKLERDKYLAKFKNRNISPPCVKTRLENELSFVQSLQKL